MAVLTYFCFEKGESLLHKLDVRFKTLCLAIVCVSCLNVRIYGLMILSMIFFTAALNVRMNILRIFKELKYFLFLLLLVFAVRALSGSGNELFKLIFFSVTLQGIYDGAFICWQIMTVVLFGIIFVSTTRPSEIKAGVQWVLKPFLFLPGKRVAVMLGLFMRFLPVIIDQAKETSDAQRARCVENRKNPVYRLSRFTVPLVTRIFERGDKLALAMEARCYSENRTDPELLSGVVDWIFLIVFTSLCLLAVKI